MIPALKVYNVDYDFLVSNYLNKELWKKSWNLFVYKDNVFTLTMHSICTKDDSIMFDIKYNKLTWDTETIWYYLNNTTIKVLKQQINGAIFRLMEKYDEQQCRNTQGYQDICNMSSEENETLTNVAEAYLDECGVTQADIRDAYIYRYVSDNARCDIHKRNYLDGHKYEQLTEMFIVFTKAIGDENRYNNVVKKIGDIERIKNIEEQIKDFKKYFNTDEYKEEITDNLIAL